MTNEYTLLILLAGKMMSKRAKNIEKNKTPNLIYVILQNAKYLIACPCTGKMDLHAVPISSSVVMGAFTAVGVSITAEDSQYFFRLHNSAIRKLTEN